MENQINQVNKPNKKLLLIYGAVLIVVLAVIILSSLLLTSRYSKVTQLNSGTATLSWDVNQESDLAGYKIYYGTTPRTSDCPPAGYTDQIDIGKTTTPDTPTYVLKNLENGKIYYFSITSYDSSGNESCFSAEMSKTINQK